MLDFLRREGRIDTPCVDVDYVEQAVEVADLSPTVQEQVEIHEMIGRLRQAMERLPQNERAVLEGIYIDGGEAKNVAQKLEVSVSHIYRLQKQGIKRIRGMLSRFMRKF